MCGTGISDRTDLTAASEINHAVDHSAIEGRSAGFHTLVALLLVLAALQLAALGPLKDSFWGFHVIGFVPLEIQFLAWFCTAAGRRSSTTRRCASFMKEPRSCWRAMTPRSCSAASAGLSALP